MLSEKQLNYAILLDGKNHLKTSKHFLISNNGSRDTCIDRNWPKLKLLAYRKQIQLDKICLRHLSMLRKEDNDTYIRFLQTLTVAAILAKTVHPVQGFSSRCPCLFSQIEVYTPIENIYIRFRRDCKINDTLLLYTLKI